MMLRIIADASLMKFRNSLRESTNFIRALPKEFNSASLREILLRYIFYDIFSDQLD